jgi:hypothetical protein
MVNPFNYFATATPTTTEQLGDGSTLTTSGYSKTIAGGANFTQVNLLFEGPKLSSLAVEFQVYGKIIPAYIGCPIINTDLIWAADLSPLTITYNTDTRWDTSEVKDYGYGTVTDKTRTSITRRETRYRATFAVSLGMTDTTFTSPEIVKIWAGDNLILDRSGGSSFVQKGDFIWRFYPGSETQEPDPTIMEIENPRYGIANGLVEPFPNVVSAMRDLSYIVFDGFDITEYGNQIPPIFVQRADSNLITKIDPTFLTGLDTPFSLAVDWEYGRAFQMFGEVMVSYDFVNNVVIQMSNTGDEFGAEAIDYSAANDLIATFSFASDTQLRIHDANTLSLLFTGPPIKRLNSSIGQTVKTTCALDILSGTAVKTFFVTIMFFNEILVHDQDGNLIQQWAEDFQPDDVSPGKPYANSQDFHYKIGRDTRRRNLSADGTVGNASVAHKAAVGRSPKGSIHVPQYNGLLVAHGPDTFPADTLTMVDYDDGTTIWEINPISLSTNEMVEQIWKSDIRNGFIALETDGFANITTIDLQDGTITDVQSKVFGVTPSIGYASDVYRIFIEKGGPGGYKYDLIGINRIPLTTYLDFMFRLAGYDNSEFTIDGSINDSIDAGYFVRRMSFKELLGVVKAVYNIDVIENETGFVVRRKQQQLLSSSYDFSAGVGDLIRDDTEGKTAVKVTIGDSDNVPSKLELTFLDKKLNFQENVAYAQRNNFPDPVSGGDQPVAIKLPLAITMEEATTLAHRMLFKAGGSDKGYEFRLPQEYLTIEPGDVGTISPLGFTFTVEALEIFYNVDYTVTVRASSYWTDQGIVKDVQNPLQIEETLDIIAKSAVFTFNWPLLRPSHEPITDDLVVYFAAGFATAGVWPGAAIDLSVDGGSQYNIVGNTADIPATGSLNSAPIPVVGAPGGVDEDTVITLNLGSNFTRFNSITRAQLLDGTYKNLSVIGSEGRYEVIQWQDITDLGIVNDRRQITISGGLLRGLRGTNVIAANNSHVLGDLFFVADDDWVLRQQFDRAFNGEVTDWRATTFNSNTTSQSRHTVSNVSQKPWSPVIVRVDTGGDPIVNIAMRTWDFDETRDWPDGNTPGTVVPTELRKMRIRFYDDETFTTNIGGEFFNDDFTGDGSGLRTQLTLTAAKLTTIFGVATIPSVIHVGAWQLLLDENGVELQEGSPHFRTLLVR